MPDRGAYGKPPIRREKSLLSNDVEMLNHFSTEGEVSNYLKSQTPAGNVAGTSILKKASNNVILSILNDKVLDVFFDKIAGSSMTSMNSTISNSVKSPVTVSAPQAPPASPMVPTLNQFTSWTDPGKSSNNVVETPFRQTVA